MIFFQEKTLTLEKEFKEFLEISTFWTCLGINIWTFKEKTFTQIKECNAFFSYFNSQSPLLKGQTISEAIFLDFKSPKKQTTFSLRISAFLEAWAEILKKICLLFGRFEARKNCCWDYLNFDIQPDLKKVEKTTNIIHFLF